MDKPFLGYNFCSAIQGQLIPQRLQNLCIRDYAQNKKLAVGFSASEYSDAEKALMLFAQFEHIDRIGGFIFFSVMLLPSNDAKRREFYELVAKAHVPVHFALEDLVLKSKADQPFIERIFQINRDPRLEKNRATLIKLRQSEK